MNLSTSTPSRRQSTGRIGQSAISGESQWQSSPHISSINILDDDSLLQIFYLYQPFLLGEDQDHNARILGGRPWVRGRWWYKLAHVCQRWRKVVLGSASYLGLSLVCTNGTPVADMLAHSPPLPLVIDCFGDITVEDEEGAILALKQCDRMLRVRLRIPVPSRQKVIVAMDEEYPILEYLVIERSKERLNEDNDSVLIFPETLQALHLRHLRLAGFTLPIGSRLLTTAVGLVTLSLVMIHPSTYFLPNILLQWISLLPQLETLSIYFNFPTPNRGVERQLTRTPIIALIILPNLCYFDFRGISTYLEALVHRISTPRLKKLKTEFFNQLTFSTPRLQEFIDQAENLRPEIAAITFSDKKVDAAVYPRGERVYALGTVVKCQHLDWQVSSIAQITNSLCQMFSAVEHLALQHMVHSDSSREHNKVDRTEWRKLLKPFRNVKILRVDEGLVKDLTHCLQLEDGEFPFELLPELQELRYSWSGNTNDVFTSFINTRQNAGRPVTLVRR